MRPSRLEVPIFRASQRMVPAGQHLLPMLPETLCATTLGHALRRWPESWGLFGGGKRIRAIRQAYQLAFPQEDADAFTAKWIAVRGEDLAASMIHMARVVAGRPSRLLCGEARIESEAGRPSVVATLHYSIDPALSLALLIANPTRSFRLPMYPFRPAIEDDRALWLARCRIPAHIERTLLPVTQPAWLIEAMRHLEDGGDVIIAMDAPFDGKRSSATSFRIGGTQMALAGSIELLAERTGAQLLFASPEPLLRKGWSMRLDAVTDACELAALATRWIEAHRLSWAGWPFLLWRDPSVSMRRDVSHIDEQH